jgi:hypothetical protein
MGGVPLDGASGAGIRRTLQREAGRIGRLYCRAAEPAPDPHAVTAFEGLIDSSGRFVDLAITESDISSPFFVLRTGRVLQRTRFGKRPITGDIAVTWEYRFDCGQPR